VDKLRVGPHDAVPGAQHPQKPEVFKWKKSMDEFFHGQLAERLGIDALSIAVVSGHASPAKVVAVDGMDDDAIRQAFSSEHRENTAKSSGSVKQE